MSLSMPFGAGESGLSYALGRYIIAAVAVVVVALTVGLVVMKLSYRKKIERERQQAIAERAAMAAGAQDVDISWNDSELPRVIIACLFAVHIAFWCLVLCATPTRHKWYGFGN